MFPLKTVKRSIVDILKKYKKIPSPEQWRQFFKILSLQEKIFFSIFLALFILSAAYLSVNFYLTNTIVKPAFGGTLREGVVGQPRFINPVYLADNDIDRDLVQLIFSGLMKYNENGKLVPDLAKDYQIKDNGKIYEIELKKAKWHDREPITADDVLFTVSLVQNPQAHSPLEIKWLGIQCEKITDSRIQFKLKYPYRSFLETLTLKIIPKHIFKDILPKNLPWQLVSRDYLVGSGPFKVEDIKQEKSGYISSIILSRNEKYYSPKPFISKVYFRFYKDAQKALQDEKNGKIDGFLLPNLEEFESNNVNFYHLSLPRYFALFFNQKKSKILSQKEIREAISYAVDKNEILNKVFSGNGKIVNSPILPDFYHFKKPNKVYEHSVSEARKILDKIGFKNTSEGKPREKVTIKRASSSFKRDLKLGDQGEDVRKLQECLKKDPTVYPEGKVTGYFGSKTKAAVVRFQEKYKKEILSPLGLKKGTGKVGGNTREKLNKICFPSSKETTPLSLTIVTCNKWPLKEIANIVKSQLEKVGFKITIEEKAISSLENDVIKPRNYEVLLFGEVLGAIPDPFSFWHSTQKENPGLNITGYQNTQADKLLREARESLNEKSFEESLEKFQNILASDIPAVFLARPDIIYCLSKRIHGFNTQHIVEPSKRFSEIEKIYIRTKRVWI